MPETFRQRLSCLRSLATCLSQSLRWRLLFLLSAIVLTTLLVIGASVLYFTYRNEQRAWQDRQAEAARHAGQSVADFIGRMQDSLVLVGLLDRDVLEAEPHLIGDFLAQNPALLEMIRLDAEGEVFASAYQDAPVLANQFTIPQSRWFSENRAGRPYLGNVQISSASEPYLIMSVPAPDGGAVAARLHMDVLWHEVAHLTFGRTGHAYVVNQEGLIIAHTDPEMALSNTSLESHPELAALLGANARSWSGAYVNLTGVRVMGVTAPVSGTQWLVITEVSRSEALATTRTALLLFSAGVGLLSLLVMLVTGRFLERVILRPMETLQEGAERIGQGELGYRIKVAGQDEVARVAGAFNVMAGRLRERDAQLAIRTEALAAEIAERKAAEAALQKTKDELEIRVAERTADLAQRNRQLLALQSAGAAMAASLELERVLETVTREMADLLEADFCAISAWDQEGDTVVTLYEHGPEGWWDETRREVFPLADYPLTKKVLVERSARQVNAADADADPAELAYMQEVDVKNLLMLPMISRDRAVGLVEIMDPSERPLTAQEIGLARLLADQAASAIENARLYQQAQAELTARRQAEERLKRYATKLEFSNRELQDFAYVASHDLQEPLRKVQAFSDRLLAGYDQALDERGRDYLERMQNAAKRMQALINDLLTYSRVTTRAQPFQAVDLGQVAREVVSDLEVRLEEVNGRVELGDLPSIEADATQMRQLLQNLIGNALKFHRQDEAPVVKVSARLLNGAGKQPVTHPADRAERCQLTVEDNGIGFDEKYVDRIFQIFQRLHGRNTYEGTGVGLATARKIVERHSGSITATSRPGQGSTFTVTLPIRQGEHGETL